MLRTSSAWMFLPELKETNIYNFIWNAFSSNSFKKIITIAKLRIMSIDQIQFYLQFSSEPIRPTRIKVLNQNVIFEYSQLRNQTDVPYVIS